MANTLVHGRTTSQSAPEGFGPENQRVADGTRLFTGGLCRQVRRPSDVYGDNRARREQSEFPEHPQGGSHLGHILIQAFSRHRKEASSLNWRRLDRELEESKQEVNFLSESPKYSVNTFAESPEDQHKTLILERRERGRNSDWRRTGVIRSNFSHQ